MERIKKILSACNAYPELSLEKLDSFQKLAEILVEENKKVNVTSITDPVGIALKHFADSLSLLLADEIKKEGLKMADIGCGGGFPGLPIKIARPDLDLTMIDSTEKKIRYVKETADKLGLQGISSVSARAEDLSSVKGPMREKFDLVTARAVARLNVLSEICLPFVRVGGTFLSMKAATALEELEEARRAIGQLGGRVKYVKELTFDFNLSPDTLNQEDVVQIDEFKFAKRYLICVEKVNPTPAQYPRPWAKITKKPI